MATETPLIHDGSQTTASADLSTTGQFLAVTISGSRTVNLATSSTTGPIYGVLQNNPTSGQAADVGIAGISKMVAGAAITAGAELMINASSQFITWVSGAGNYKVGRALETVSGSGQIFTGLIYNPNVSVLT